ncbi:MAG: DUF58 domain-containing protein [bacterium]
MISHELIKKIKRIEIKTNRIVNDVLGGEYLSAFKGQGMEFSEVREYLPGDDVRAIDWNVTARMQHPYIKKYMEERELTVILMVDASSSGDFGSFKQMKGEIAVEICALLAFSAIKNNDRVGLIIFTSGIEKFIAPKKGRKHVLRVIRELLYFKPRHAGTDIGGALKYLKDILSKRAVVFLVSDFISSEFEAPIKIANKEHDIIMITVTDPREIDIPAMGLLELQDAETGETILVDTSENLFQKNFREHSLGMRSDLNDLMRRIGIDLIHIRTDRDYVDPLVRFFKIRERKLRK